jgi:hypothetical protein
MRFSSELKDLTQDTIQANDRSPYYILLTQSHNLWKDQCASENAPAADTLDKSSARTRQIAQHRVKMAYAHGPLMLALDRRIFDTPLEERLHSRTSDLVAWTKTIFPVIHHSISEARALNPIG